MSEKFETLDAIRGAAAIAVVVWHSEPLFGWRPASGYLAVDLFFMLSGFVIAHAYDARLNQGLSVARFMMLRCIRLYPLYILGTGLSALGLLAAFAIGAQVNWTAGRLATSLLLGSVFLPSASTNGTLYPLNPPAWSLLAELMVNFIFSAGIIFFTFRRIITIIPLALLALIVATMWFGDLNTGSKWSDAVGAVPRVLFAFPVGLMLCRLHRDHGWRINVHPILPLAAVIALLSISLPGNGLYDLIVVTFAFPAIVLAGASRGMPGFRNPATFLGATSYAVYALHVPLLGFFSRLQGLLAKAGVAAPFSGILFLIFILAAAWIADKIWDIPIRAWLTRRLTPPRGTSLRSSP